MLMQAEPVRRQHALVQGTPEWLFFKDHHYGASDAAAALNLSRKETRNAFLKRLKTGIKKEFSDYVQKYVIDKGHEVEALARPIVEELIDKELYQQVWSYGTLSCSCDGLDEDQEEGWENKQYNAEYYAMVLRGEMPEEHMPQVQQSLYVTGAKRWFFTISDGTRERTVGMWVYPDEAWFERIKIGWEQVDKDLETFEVTEEAIKTVATVDHALMMPSIRVTGQLSVQSNLDAFGDSLRRAIELVNADPKTDEDFVNNNKLKKCFENAEEWLDQQEHLALAQFDEINAVLTQKRSLKDLAKDNRLSIEKLYKVKTDSIKAKILADATLKYRQYVAELQASIDGVTLTVPSPDFANAMKNKKTVASLQNAVDSLLAESRPVVDKIAAETREKLAWFNENASEYTTIFPDLDNVIRMPSDGFKATVLQRVTEHKDGEEKRIAEAEERGRRQVEAANKRVAETSSAAPTASVCEVVNTGYTESSPGRVKLIKAIADKFWTTEQIAEQWLIQEFQK